MNPLRELQEFSQSVAGQCPEPVAIRRAACKQAVNFSWERVSGIC